MHIKQTQIVLASAMHKHGYIQYHMLSIDYIPIDLLPILIHQLDKQCKVNHSSMHIKQAQIVLASAMHNNAYIQYYMHSIASTNIDLPPILIHQLDNQCIVNHLNINKT